MHMGGALVPSSTKQDNRLLEKDKKGGQPVGMLQFLLVGCLPHRVAPAAPHNLPAQPPTRRLTRFTHAVLLATPLLCLLRRRSACYAVSLPATLSPCHALPSMLPRLAPGAAHSAAAAASPAVNKPCPSLSFAASPSLSRLLYRNATPGLPPPHVTTCSRKRPLLPAHLRWRLPLSFLTPQATV